VNRDRAEQRHIAEQLLEEGLTPLAIMKARMLRRPLSNGMLVTDDQFVAACALAPYLHPKLTAMAVRDMTPAVGSGSKIRPRVSGLFSTKPLEASLLVDGVLVEETELFPKDVGGRPVLE
jgi:hypothetical protein